MSQIWSKWLIATVALPIAAAILVAVLAPEPSGHWVEHLSGVALRVAVLALVVALAALLGRRIPAVLGLCILAAVIGIAMQATGDWRAADALWRTTGEPSGAASEAAHELASQGDLLVVLAGAAFAIGAGVLRRTSPLIAVGALVLVVVPPPFLWPAAGVLFVLLHALTTGRSLRPAAGA